MAANTLQAAGGDNTLPPEQQPGTERLVTSEIFQTVCYWAALVLLCGVGAYLIHWKLGHPSIGPGVSIKPSDDPFGITTPPWIVEMLTPFYVAGVLGHALWQAIHGRRAWSHIVAAAALIGVLASGKGLEALIK